MQATTNDFYIQLSHVVLAHRCVFAKGDACDYLTGRTYFGLTYAKRGGAVYEIAGGGRFSIAEGEVAFIPRGLCYLLHATEEYEHYTVNFNLDTEGCVGSGVKEMLTCGRMTVFSPAAPEIYEKHFARLADTWRTKTAGYRMRAAAEAYTLLSSFVTEHCILGIDPTTYGRVLPAKEYLDKHYAREISIGMLANLCNMSETGFRRLFLFVFGKTAMTYKNELLLLHACDLLTDNLYTVGEIAARCGFRDQNYFSRFFKKHKGVSPSDYRAKYTLT